MKKILLNNLLVIFLIIILNSYSFAKIKTVTLDFINADLVQVIKILAKEYNCDVVIDNNVKGTVNLSLKDVPLDTALSLILKLSNFDYKKLDNLIIVSKPSELSRIASALAVSPSSKYVSQTIPLEYAPLSSVVKAITENIPEVNIFSDSNLNLLIVQGNLSDVKRAKYLVAKLDIPKKEFTEEELGMITELVELKYADTKDLESLIKKTLPLSDFKSDSRLNAFVIKGTKEMVSAFKDYIKKVDLPLDQVFLEVKVVSLSKTAAKTFGANFTTGSSSFTTTLKEAQWNSGGYADAPTYLDIRLGGIFPFARTPISINYALDALITKGEAEILANPKITTLSGKQANINSSRKYRYVYYDSRSGNYQVNEVDVGVKITVTPTVSSDGYIVVEVKPELSDFVQLVANIFPWTNQRSANVTVRVKDGESFAIGGLIKTTISETDNKIPLLGDLPIVGNLFKGKYYSREESEIVILVIPKIITKS